MEFISFLNQVFLFFTNFLFSNFSTHFSLITVSHFFFFFKEREHTIAYQGNFMKGNIKNSQVLVQREVKRIASSNVCCHLWPSLLPVFEAPASPLSPSELFSAGQRSKPLASEPAMPGVTFYLSFNFLSIRGFCLFICFQSVK